MGPLPIPVSPGTAPVPFSLGASGTVSLRLGPETWSSPPRSLCLFAPPDLLACPVSPTQTLLTLPNFHTPPPSQSWPLLHPEQLSARGIPLLGTWLSPLPLIPLLYTFPLHLMSSPCSLCTCCSCPHGPLFVQAVGGLSPAPSPLTPSPLKGGLLASSHPPWASHTDLLFYPRLVAIELLPCFLLSPGLGLTLLCPCRDPCIKLIVGCAGLHPGRRRGSLQQPRG